MTKTTQADAAKIFKTRDSATSLLRKLGIQARDYNFFIEKMGDGRFACQVAKAEMHLESLKQPKTEHFHSVTEAEHKAHRGEDKTRRTGISAVARAMILDGKTNQEVWEALKQQFNLDDSKRHYPTWYRCEMKRSGQLPR